MTPFPQQAMCSERKMSTDPSDVTLHQLGPDDLGLMAQLLDLFGGVFEEPQTYGAKRPDDAYMARLLGGDHFIALAALKQGNVVGGLAAYVFDKFEQARRKIYIYDLAVAQAQRRRGIATALIEEVRRLAAARGAWVVFIQAEKDDAAPVALYSRLGRRQEVLHFDIPVAAPVEGQAGCDPASGNN